MVAMAMVARPRLLVTVLRVCVEAVILCGGLTLALVLSPRVPTAAAIELVGFFFEREDLSSDGNGSFAVLMKIVMLLYVLLFLGRPMPHPRALGPAGVFGFFCEYGLDPRPRVGDTLTRIAGQFQGGRVLPTTPCVRLRWV